MSSFVRRLQIRHMKRQGFVRTKFRIARNPDGSPRLERVSKSGLILNPKGKAIGTRWPPRIPAVG